jgi:uncharacterized protein YndB with AHSA1/START domain
VLAHSESIEIAKPATIVWALVGDPEAWPRWAGDVADVQVHGDLAMGTAISYSYRGRRADVTISAYEHERLLEIAGSETSYEMRESVALKGINSGTHVSITMGFEPTVWWARIIAPLVSPLKSVLLGRELRRSLLALQRAAEGA